MANLKKCEMPGCNNKTEVLSAKWCASCYYPDIDKDHEMYKSYRAEGYGVYQSKLFVGWADPPESET